MKKLIIVLLSAILCFGTLTACTSTGTSKEEAKTNEVLIGFESVRELLTVYTQNVEGLVLCDDESIVTQGEKAMKVIGKAIPEGGEAANMRISFVPGNSYFKKTDYTDVSYFSVDVYNPNDCDYEVAFVNGGVSTDIFVLKPGKNFLQIYNNRGIELYKNNGGVSWLSLVFRGQTGKSPSFVVDNFKCYYTDTKATSYTFDKKKSVWHTFENEAEVTLFSYQGRSVTVFDEPQFSINRDSRYILSGTGSLKVSFRAASDGSVCCSAFRTADNMMADLNNYLGADRYYLSSDIYNDYDYAIVCDMVVFSNYANETYTRSFTIPAKSWSNSEESRIYLNDMLDSFTGEGLDCMCIAYYFSGITGNGSVYIDSIGVKK